MFGFAELLSVCLSVLFLVEPVFKLRVEIGWMVNGEVRPMAGLQVG